MIVDEKEYKFYEVELREAEAKAAIIKIARDHLLLHQKVDTNWEPVIVWDGYGSWVVRFRKQEA